MRSIVSISLIVALAGAIACKKSESKEEPAKGGGDVKASKDAGTAKAATTDATPKAPSTGNELPAEGLGMSADQARELMARAIEEVAKDQPNCERVVEALNLALPIAAPEVTAESKPAYEALGKCASKTKRWRTVVSTGLALLKVSDDPDFLHHIIRALAELGEYDRAIEGAKELAVKYPKQEAKLAAAVTFVYCRAEAWQPCIKTADQVLAYLDKEQIADDEARLMARMMRALAWIMVGKGDEGTAELDAIEAVLKKPFPGGAKFRAAAVKAKQDGMLIDIVIPPQLPLGVYHLMGKQETGALVTLKAYEHAGRAHSLRIEVEVPGVTERSSNTVTLDAGGGWVKFANPPLKMSFDPSIVRSAKPAQIALRIVEIGDAGEKVIYDETVQIEVLPRDYLPLRRKVGADSMVPTYGFMAAWVMSNDKGIDQFLSEAKRAAPQGMFVGTQGPTIPQVKALYDTLKARGVTYVMDPTVDSETSFVQRTRLPSEVLASTNAQCLEGTLLFASLFEAIGLDPIIVLVPGHAFVGWHPVPQDGTKGNPVFVETTMVGNATFEQALEVATRRAVQEHKAGHFEQGVSRLIEVVELRKQGFQAQPM